MDETAWDVIRVTLAHVLQVFAASAKRTGEQCAAFYSDPAPIMRLICPLAEGADQLAAEEAIRQGYELQAILPFGAERYVQTFETPEGKARLHQLLQQATSRIELPANPTDSDAPFAYETAARLMLHHTDVLIAIWDGKEARGRGGTADVVEAALSRNIPVIWIRAHAPETPRLIRHQAGRRDIRGTLAIAQNSTDDALASLVPSIVGPPDSPKDRQAIKTYLGERLRRRNPWVLYRGFLKVLRAGAQSPPSNIGKGTADPVPKGYMEVGWLDAGKEAELRERHIQAPRHWARNLSRHYSEVYRSSYLLNFLFAALAVLFALLGLLSDSMLGLKTKPLWVAVEVILIGAILLNTYANRTQRWHQRWLDYRYLAEHLRYARILRLSGITPPGKSLAHGGHAHEAGNRWVDWYFRAHLRDAGLPSIVVTKQFVANAAGFVSGQEIAEQSRYHKANADRMERLEHHLDILGLVFFALTGLSCVAFLVAWTAAELPSWIGYVLTFATALLPAVGSAAYGIRIHGDFSGAAKRSHAIQQRLEELAVLLGRLDEEDDSSDSSGDFEQLVQLSDDVVETMASEMADWLFVFSQRPVVVPG